MLIAIRPLRIITKRVEHLLTRSSRHSQGNRKNSYVQYLFRLSLCMIFEEISYTKWLFSFYLLFIYKYTQAKSLVDI